MRTLFALAFGAIALLSSGTTLAQSGNMMHAGTGSGGWMCGWMNGWMCGWMDGNRWMDGQAGLWLMILVVVVVIGLVAWIVKRGRK